MRPRLFHEIALSPALKLLPVDMGSPAGAAMVLAICLQESGFEARFQNGGPARGFAQFERNGGVRGVMTHTQTESHARVVCVTLSIAPYVDNVYEAIAYNDVLAAAFARLLLWTYPTALPDADDPDEGWKQYFATWRPGKPHREMWDRNFEQAWQVVADATNGS